MTKLRLHLCSKQLHVKYQFVKLKEVKMNRKNTECNQRLIKVIHHSSKVAAGSREVRELQFSPQLGELIKNLASKGKEWSFILITYPKKNSGVQGNPPPEIKAEPGSVEEEKFFSSPW
jgi:hypothetical protein